jgi:hypothetical protein
MKHCLLRRAIETFLFDTSGHGNSNTGHNYGTALTANQKSDLIEYLKTL